MQLSQQTQDYCKGALLRWPYCVHEQVGNRDEVVRLGMECEVNQLECIPVGLMMVRELQRFASIQAAPPLCLVRAITFYFGESLSTFSALPCAIFSLSTGLIGTCSRNVLA